MRTHRHACRADNISRRTCPRSASFLRQLRQQLQRINHDRTLIHHPRYLWCFNCGWQLTVWLITVISVGWAITHARSLYLDLRNWIVDDARSNGEILKQSLVILRLNESRRLNGEKIPLFNEIWCCKLARWDVYVDSIGICAWNWLVCGLFPHTDSVLAKYILKYCLIWFSATLTIFICFKRLEEFWCLVVFFFFNSEYRSKNFLCAKCALLQSSLPKSVNKKGS